MADLRYSQKNVQFTWLIRNENNVIVSNWYQKETFSGRVLHCASNHPFQQKIAQVHNQVDRVTLLLNTEFHSQNLNDILKF